MVWLRFRCDVADARQRSHEPAPARWRCNTRLHFREGSKKMGSCSKRIVEPKGGGERGLEAIAGRGAIFVGLEGPV